MRICYILLSPSYGMHQYTADLANRMLDAGHEVQLVTTTEAPRDRYSPGLTIQTPVATTTTGLSTETLRFTRLRDAQRSIATWRPDVAHITGPHVWNVALVKALSGQRIPVIHTIHDLEPHHGKGTRYRALLRLWNRAIISSSDHILVHGEEYRERLTRNGLRSDQVTYTPLLHLPLSFACQKSLEDKSRMPVKYEPWALFLGRLEAYKGLECLLTAYQMMDGADGSPGLVIAGEGDVSTLWSTEYPAGVELRNRFITDEEVVDLLQRCGLLVMPYLHATQSALVATAHYFRKPVVVSRTGALPQYVQDGRTGRVVEPANAPLLARCLHDMLGDPARLAAMGSAGRNWHDQQRSAEKESLASMYASVSKPC